jgi:hypothetical protein
MVIENTASNVGDVLLIAGNAPIVGVVTLTGYNDDTLGETGTKYFIKEFSYSLDGIFFSEWEILNDSNIQNIQISSEVLYINYRYTRQGSDATGLLTWLDTHLVGIFSIPFCPNYFVLPKSIFKDYFCYNPQQLGLCVVLTKKMFSPAQKHWNLPKFLKS